MKKILFILLVTLSLPIFGQRYIEQNIATIVGADTTLYLNNSRHGLLTIDFTQVVGSTGYVDVGYTDDRISFVSASTDTDSVSFNKTTYTKTANGYTRNRIAITKTEWPGSYIAVKIVKNGATAGLVKITY
jgi:hypothetical protein